MSKQPNPINQRGIALLFEIIIVAGIIALGVVGYMAVTSKQVKDKPGQTNSKGQQSGEVSWNFDGQKWQANGTPPSCSNPLEVASPVDLSRARAVLYPGQTRGGNYKPHGGFLFNGSNDDISVKAALDAKLVSGSRYIEQGEVQYLLFFVNDCGLAYRFDHLQTLSSSMQKIADSLPAAQENNSQTTKFSRPTKVKQGDVIATSVGFKKTHNVSVDFGVYDLRSPNQVSKNASFAQQQGNYKEQSFYGVCWLNILPPKDSVTVKALPAGDQQNGTKSDYCQ